MVAATAPAMATLEKKIKQLEVADEDDDESAGIITQSTSSGENGDDGDSDFVYRVAWDSKSKNKIDGYNPQLQSTSTAAAQALKVKGNALYKAGDAAGALVLYKQAIAACPDSCETPDILSTIHNNVAAAMLRLGRSTEAAAAARRAHLLSPSWPKPLRRLAEAHLATGEHAAAVASCQKGEELCPKNSLGHSEFTPLLDRVAIEAALLGNYVGFNGRQLEVRSAGGEAWLGRPAPHVPALDGPLDEESALPSDDLSTAKSAPPLADLLPSNTVAASKMVAGAATPASFSSPGATSARADALSTWHYSDTLAAARQARTSFRCVREALAAAKDGDRILLRRGVHNGMGQSVEVAKRVLIEGEGALGETVIDQRANCPTFRVTRGGAVIRNIDLDQTGFREAILVEGSGSSSGGAPLIDDCIIKCSGDDAVNVAGSARPLLRRCVITGKKCGVRVFEEGCVRLEGCVVEKCGEQGVKAQEQGKIEATLSTICECEEEGVVLMDSTRGSFLACDIRDNKGPGVDCSGSAKADIRGGDLVGNVGGVWLWEDSTAELDGVRLDGGSALVIMSHGNGKPAAKSCVIKGTVHAPDAAWEGLLDASNRLEQPDKPTDFPPEEGPFCWVPNRFTRKQ